MTDTNLSFSVFETFRKAWADDDLRTRLRYVMIIFAVYAFGVHVQIPIPGVTAHELTDKLKDNAFFQLVNMMGGGALRRLSIFALGLNPYITASIIFQILQQANPVWKEEMKEGGEYARQKMNVRIRWLTLALCIGQSLGFMQILISGFGGQISLFTKVGITVFWTAGAMFVLWLGEQISERGIGNGVSIMIFAGIVIALPGTIQGIAQGVSDHVVSWFSVIFFIALFVATTWFVVFFTVAQRRIPIQHMRRMQGTRMMGGQVNYLPFSVNLSGVIPLIFAYQILVMPQTFATMLPQGKIHDALTNIGAFINPGNPTASGLNLLIGSLLFIVIIFFFTYFYTAVQYNVDDIADNLKRSQSFIPGIRPGKQTSDFLNGVISRITVAGASFLSAIALLQMLAPRFTGISRAAAGGTYILGGTSLLILVQVALDTMKQIEANVLMKEYGS